MSRPAIADSSLGSEVANCFQQMRSPSSLIGRSSTVLGWVGVAEGVLVGAVCVRAAVDIPALRMDIPCGRRMVTGFPLCVLSWAMGLFPLAALLEATLGVGCGLAGCAVGAAVLL